MREQILNTIKDLIKIPSISGNEIEIAKILQYCRDFFNGYSVNIREFKYQDASPVMLISNQEGDEFDILVVGHLDIVPASSSMFVPKTEENNLYGRGSSDMKSQIAIALYTMQHVIDNKLPVKFGILITTDEETNSNGIKALIKNENITPKIVMDYDAGDIGTIIEKYKHSIGIKVTAKGIDGHSSRPWDGINAIEKLIKAIGKIQQNFGQYSKELPTPDDTWLDTMAVTAFNSPSTMKVIPDNAQALINFRLTDKMSLEDLKDILNHACDDCNCTYEVMMASCGCYMDADDEVIKPYRKIAEEVIGKKIKISHMNGATDARMFADKAVIIMHSPTGYNHHNAGEYVEIDTIFKFLDIQRQFIASVAKTKK